ncbi:MAG TPA: CSLREA domain-containing protein [Solirubrobacterales bacterium]
MEGSRRAIEKRKAGASGEVTVRRTWGLIVAMLVIALAVPGVANAAFFTVNSTADEADLSPGMAGCLTAAGKCTLRAAIEESNLASASVNEIVFDDGVFSGQAAGTIDLGGGLPTITEPVLIEGGRCQTESGVTGPCVTINGTNSSAALTVESDETVIGNLHILNASIGIKVAAGEGFELLGNWFGGGPRSGPMLGGAGTGILVGPGSGGGVVGGKGPTDGNLFISGGTGIEIHGASHVKVLGNRFGFEPDGTAAEWPYGNDIQVTSAPDAGYEAVGNEIGTTLSEAALSTPACDGGCNLMAGAGYTLILFSLSNIYGQDGPPVDTRISGNQIGLDVAGTAVVSTGGGIATGSSMGTIVGGPEPGDGNRINGVGDAIYGGGRELMIANNLIGVDSTGSEILAPAHGGIAVYSNFKDPSLEATIVENEVVVNGGLGISNSGLGATIAGNEVVGAGIGIATHGNQGLQGNLIEANSVAISSEEGIYLEDSDNEVLGNEVFASGYANIAVAGQQPAGATGNVIGGDSEASENELSLSGGPAIAIFAREGTENEVARNYGFENEGPFIRLSPIDWSETVGPNGGIEPPEFSSATTTGAAGSAEPGALVRVFRNEYEDEGELESFLGQVHANNKGEWSLSFEVVPAGTVLVATQTRNGGTSELALAPTPGPPPKEARPEEVERARVRSQLRLPALETKIVEGPRRRGRSVRFRFRSNRPSATFECRLDRRRFRSCGSPAVYRRLAGGRHTFEVRAVVASGESDRRPARRTFAVPSLHHHGHRR